MELFAAMDDALKEDLFNAIDKDFCHRTDIMINTKVCAVRNGFFFK